ncbi:MAG: multiheme c-type cytochrome [Planctomycetota bacterium]
MLRLVTCISVLTVAASCIVVSEPTDKADVITVFLTGNGLGVLKPCGCSGGQLGGLDRRRGVLNTVASQRRMIVDTGMFVEGNGEQDLIKFDIMTRAFDLLDYDLVNLTNKDITIAKDLGLLDIISSFFNIITSHKLSDANLPARFTKKFALKDKMIAVTVATFDAEAAPVEQIERLFTQEGGVQTVNILILNRCTPGIIKTIAKEADVDCLICPGESDEPALLSAPNKSPLVISVGRFGRYVSKVQIKAGKDGGKAKLSFSKVPVKEEPLPGEPLVELYEEYQQLVREADLLAKIPRYFLPDDLAYTGSKSCKSCHEYEYEKWSTKSHAHAYETLKRVGSESDPECVGCHVVGLKYEGGFVSEQETADLKDVGCEVCHGPGSEHIRTLGDVKTRAPRQDCIDCHTSDNSVNYAGNEAVYFEKIIHWREPKAQRDVK